MPEGGPGEGSGRPPDSWMAGSLFRTVAAVLAVLAGLWLFLDLSPDRWPLPRFGSGQDSGALRPAAAAILVLVVAAQAWLLRRRSRVLRKLRSLEEMEETLGPVLEHAADAVVLLDSRHRIVSWNRGAEETLGYLAAEVLGQEYALLVPGREEEPELRHPLSPGATVRDLRTQRFRRDGRAVDVSITRSHVPAAELSKERFVEILRDISETRRMDEDLLRTEKMAAVGKISSKVVHEIRNPLASINLNVDLLQDSLDALPPEVCDPEGREILGVIKREIRRLSQITEEYLQFSRLPRVAFKPEQVNSLLVELSDLVRPSIARRGIRLVTNLDERNPEAVCDATLLRQALLNLVRNSMDAVEGEHAQIQMGIRWFPGGDGRGGSLEISVEDNGRGIPEEDRERIFEPFFTTKRDGTGLGLALVARAVQEHSGRIECRSLEGKGTAFRMVLPMRPPQSEAVPGGK